MIGVDVKGGRKEEVARECRRPCMKRKVHPAVHGCSSMWHFVVPFFVTFWVIRYITAGFVDPLTEVLTATSLVFTILFCCGAGCCRMPHCVALWLGMTCCAVWAPLFILNK